MNQRETEIEADSAELQAELRKVRTLNRALIRSSKYYYSKFQDMEALREINLRKQMKIADELKMRLKERTDEST